MEPQPGTVDLKPGQGQAVQVAARGMGTQIVLSHHTLLIESGSVAYLAAHPAPLGSGVLWDDLCLNFEPLLERMERPE